MSVFEIPVGDQVGIVTVPDELDAYHRARGHVEVLSAEAVAARDAALEATVADLKGADLDAAVAAAKIAHPSTLSADEKRTALLEHGADDTTKEN